MASNRYERKDMRGPGVRPSKPIRGCADERVIGQETGRHRKREKQILTNKSVQRVYWVGDKVTEDVTD